jgi:NAD(P)-dependent dehydrogenase (short-subunit alcohol dehydrogenase family)
MELMGRTAIVAGAGQGLGRGIALVLAGRTLIA